MNSDDFMNFECQSIENRFPKEVLEIANKANSLWGANNDIGIMMYSDNNRRLLLDVLDRGFLGFLESKCAHVYVGDDELGNREFYVFDFHGFLVLDSDGDFVNRYQEDLTEVSIERVLVGIANFFDDRKILNMKSKRNETEQAHFKKQLNGSVFDEFLCEYHDEGDFFNDVIDANERWRESNEVVEFNEKNRGLMYLFMDIDFMKFMESKGVCVFIPQQDDSKILNYCFNTHEFISWSYNNEGIMARDVESIEMDPDMFRCVMNSIIDFFNYRY